MPTGRRAAYSRQPGKLVGMQSVVRVMERHQIALYLVALAGGAALGLLRPAVAHPLQAAINPTLGLLIYATFLGVPFAKIGQAFRDWRFLTTALVVDFILAPIVAFALSRIVVGNRVLLIGVLFVLLCPCVDYVIVFTGLAGGAKDRLLAAAPILMLGQMLLLPGYLWLMAGTGVVTTIDLAPFADAFLLLIVLPLVAAGLTQLLATRTEMGLVVKRTVLGAMVPLMMLTLAVVVASQIHGVSQQLGALLHAVPVFVLFAAAMVLIGTAVGRISGLDVPSRRAIVFTGTTRNSLVVLPLVLALPADFDLAPLVVVTQTLVELVVMVVMVRLVPRMIPAQQTHIAAIRPVAGESLTDTGR